MFIQEIKVHTALREAALTLEQKLELEELFEEEGIILFKEKEVKTTLLIRLSAILYYPLLFLLFIFRPVKWLITGKSYYSQKGLFSFIFAWDKCLH